MKSSPFHVRFGKFKVLKTSQTPLVVNLKINDADVDTRMFLGANGQGYFPRREIVLTE